VTRTRRVGDELDETSWNLDRPGDVLFPLDRFPYVNENRFAGVQLLRCRLGRHGFDLGACLADHLDNGFHHGQVFLSVRGETDSAETDVGNTELCWLRKL
jgi:hypothetical protein